MYLVHIVFLSDDGKLRKDKNYFPFGVDPRLFIRNNFAMAGMALLLTIFLNKFKINPTKKYFKIEP